MINFFKKIGLNKKQFIFFLLVCLFVSIISFCLHFFSQPNISFFPSHVDEWHHLSQARNLEEGSYNFNSLPSLEIGFHFFLFLLNKIFSLVPFYKVISLFWIFLTSIILFFLIYKITEKNFFVSIFSILFFGAIGRDNLFLGFPLFTPLTFATPLIFIYLFLFIEGLQQKNKKTIFISLIIMLSLILFHAPSVLFSFPILIFYLFLYKEFVKKEFQFFLLFLLVPLGGLFFYQLTTKINLFNLKNIFNLLIFPNNWGGVKITNISFVNLYPLIGFLLGIVGGIGVFIQKRKKYFPYFLLAGYLFISLLIFNIFKISLFSPVQRNYYYFLLSLPFLSSLGFNYLLNFFKKHLNKIDTLARYKKIKKGLVVFLIICILFLIYFPLFLERESFSYQTISAEEYADLKYLSQFPLGNVIAPLQYLSVAIKSVSGHEPIATPYFFGDDVIREDVNHFFEEITCAEKKFIIKKYFIRYIISKEKISCEGYNLLYYHNLYIYNTSLVD